MNRNINLARIAKKGVEQAVKHGLTPENDQLKQSKPITIKTESPYFSPISNRTRNKQLQKLSKSPNNIEKPSTSMEKVEEKKVAAGKHIKIEYDQRSSSEIKSEDVKPSSRKIKTEKIEPSPNKGKAEKIESSLDKVKVENDESVEKTSISSDTKTAIKKSEIKPKKRVSENEKPTKVEADTETAEKQLKWEPENWRQMFDKIKKMRADRSAPVDTMGCDRCADRDAPENIQRYHHLVALMLSSQTKDAVTYEAMNRLKQHGLTPHQMVDIKDTELEKLLHPVSFYKTKAKHIKLTAQILLANYESDIPNTIKELVKLPGVGPKMAHIVMRVAWGIVTGIGVDTHVHRIANRLKWVQKPTKTPEETRVALESWLPFELWWEVNELLVGFGQNTCKPVHPLCSGCLNNDICPSRFKC